MFRLTRDDLNFSHLTISRVIKGEVREVLPGWLLIEQSKNGGLRVIPMNRRVRKILPTLCEDVSTSAYVFRSVRTGRRINDIKKGFASACDAAGIDNLTFHDLRHTWSSSRRRDGRARARPPRHPRPHAK